MVASGDWLTPRLNGVAHYDKPPLAYWSIASGIRVLGVNEWGARIGAAIAGVVLLLATSAIAGGAFLAPLVLASAPLFFALTRLLATDVFLAAAVAAFYVAYLLAPTRERGWTLWMFAALGAGFLAKGPVVLMHTVLPLAAVALWKRDRTLLAPLESIRGWLLFLAMSIPWYVFVMADTPGLLSWLLHHELWMRYTSTVHHRTGPPWYFVLVVLAGLLPWTFAALEGIGRAVRDARASNSRADAVLLCWAVVPVLFFSASGSKLPAYILPEIPALAILTARALERPRLLARWGTALLTFTLAVLIEFHGPYALAGVVGAQHAATLPLPAAAHVAAGLFLAAAIAMAARVPTAATLAVLGGLYGLFGSAKAIEGPLGSVAPMTRILERARQPQESVIELGVFSAGLPFYTKKLAPMVDVPRREAFEAPGASAEPFLARESLPGMVARDRRVWVYSSPGRGEREADSLGLHYTSVARTRTRELGVFEPMPMP